MPSLAPRAWLATAAGVALAAAPSLARAELLWDGDAAKGLGVFDGTECTNGTVTVVDDPSYGKVWKFFFPDGDTRCEVRGSKGYTITQGTEIYVGWRVKYDVALGTLRYVFQMKGYPPPALQSNHPIVFATEQNNLVLINYDLQDQRHTIWQSPIARDAWLTIVLRMNISKDPAVGFVELWFNGTKQKFVNGAERISANTFDAGRTLVKWGIYRGGQGPGDCYEFLDAPRIGTSYADVAPAGSGTGGADAGIADAGPGADGATLDGVGDGEDARPGEPDAGPIGPPDAAAGAGVGGGGGARGGGSGGSSRPSAGGSTGRAATGGSEGQASEPGMAPPAGCGCRLAKAATGDGRDGAPAAAGLVVLVALARRRRRLGSLRR
jgi:hypothetical protein